MSPTKQAKPTATKVNKKATVARNQNSLKWQNGEKKNYTANKHKIMIQAAL